MSDTYCTVAECEAPTRQGRARCEFHEKRHQRGQRLTAPKVERLSPKERLFEAAHRLADADAEDDKAYQQAERDLLRTARQTGTSLHGELVRQGMAEARKRGIKPGRRPVLTPEKARALIAQHGSTAKAAQAAGVRRETVWRALGRVAESVISQRAA